MRISWKRIDETVSFLIQREFSGSLPSRLIVNRTREYELSLSSRLK